MNIFELTGIAGFVCYLASYALLQTGRIKGDSLTYVIANIISASLVLISLSESFNLASALIQIAWILISAIGLIRIVLAKPNSQLNNLSSSSPQGSRIDLNLS